MGMLLNVQLSVFSNYHIEATAKNVTTLMSKLNELGRFEYLPNTIPGQSFDLVAGKVIPTSNLAFVTKGQLSKVICMDDRIDCQLNYDEEHQDTIESSINFCKDVLNIIMSEFPICGNRLAININQLGEPIETRILDTNIGKRNASLLDFYEDKDVNDWATRTNARIPTADTNFTEILNVITEISLAQNEQTEEIRFLQHLDINTVPENQNIRFSYESIGAFINATKDIVNKLLTDFKELESVEE